MKMQKLEELNKYPDFNNYLIFVLTKLKTEGMYNYYLLNWFKFKVQSWRKSSVRLINEPCLSQCPSRKYYFVVVQLAIAIYSLPVSTANGIKFSFIKMSDRDLKFVYLFCQTDMFLFVIKTPIRKCKHRFSRNEHLQNVEH
jgi:hypothetical protein